MTPAFDSNRTRRGFLKTVFLAATATAAGGFAAPAARGAVRQKDVVVPLDVAGLRIARHVVGGVLVQSDEYDYLTFDACQRNAAGQAVDAGTAVIRLTACVDWRFRVDGDQHLYGDDGVDPAELASGRTVEVLNSSWVTDLVEADPSLRRSALHHCIFTFRDTTFECVLSRYDHIIHTGPFADLYADLVEGKS